MNRFMRLLVMFDLPVVRAQDRKEATKFRNFLLRDGYDMLQYSVYTRICANSDAAKTHVKRLLARAPVRGAVRVIMVTNKQFADAIIATGKRKPQEKKINESQLLLF